MKRTISFNGETYDTVLDHTKTSSYELSDPRLRNSVFFPLDVWNIIIKYVGVGFLLLVLPRVCLKFLDYIQNMEDPIIRKVAVERGAGEFLVVAFCTNDRIISGIKRLIQCKCDAAFAVTNFGKDLYEVVVERLSPKRMMKFLMHTDGRIAHRSLGDNHLHYRLLLENDWAASGNPANIPTTLDNVERYMRTVCTLYASVPDGSLMKYQQMWQEAYYGIDFFAKIPTEVLIKIISNISSVKSILITLPCVCKRFKTLIEANESIPLYYLKALTGFSSEWIGVGRDEEVLKKTAFMLIHKYRSNLKHGRGKLNERRYYIYQTCPSKILRKIVHEKARPSSLNANFFATVASDWTAGGDPEELPAKLDPIESKWLDKGAPPGWYMHAYFVPLTETKLTETELDEYRKRECESAQIKFDIQYMEYYMEYTKGWKEHYNSYSESIWNGTICYLNHYVFECVFE